MTHRIHCVQIVMAILTMTLLLASCGRKHPSETDVTEIPRPRAYPRIQLYDTVYTDRHGLEAGFIVNEAAEVNRKMIAGSGQQPHSSGWADVVYPAYSATLHCTFTPVDDSTRSQVVDNRTERMALNIGGNTAEQIGLSTTSGYDAIVLTTVGSAVTPLQFVAAGRKWVVSGALTFEAESIDADSILPIISAVRTDVIHAIKHLE